MNTKNIIIIIVAVVIIGIIASFGLKFLTFNSLKKAVEEEQEKIIEEVKENNDAPMKVEKLIDIGEPAPEITLEDLNGNTVSLKDYEGEKIVLLNFWASWCPPCRAEMPDLDKLYEENKDDDFIVLAVNLGESEDTVKKFIEQNGYGFPVLLDKTQEVGITYQTFSIPTSVMVDKEGKIRAYRPGLMTYAEMKEMLDYTRGQ
ncbi:Peroxiredoxin [Proteiniborus ethanoligenes]|uniref:Peroxiredoxin n=1 Tax=Proteiniborus ethanoligenes TaxID=415015 RepID=A0A1H3M5A7_9FIRM|nr:TlpA disulfide reductase family protein [Proteiniborus ethanoligenes]SDY71175.1 Peroxiredoxin [Proteiniborus ethanoligenes]